MSSKKAIKKVASTFSFGASDMLLDRKDPQVEAAKRAAQQQEQQAREQSLQAAEAAAQAQKQIQLDAERQQVTQAAAEQQTVQTEAPTLMLSGVEEETVQDKRKKFRGTALGGKPASSLRVG